MDHDNADFVVITGDLTHHGDNDSYEVFARELRRLSVPSHLLVGNHDDARAFAYQFPETQRCEYGFIQGSKRTPFGLCLFLDTSEKGSASGIYCDKRRCWLSNALNETDGPVMLFMHHAPFSFGLPDRTEGRLQDCDAFWQVLAPHKDRIRHIFVGHAPRIMFGNWRGISVSGMCGLHDQEMIEQDPDHTGQNTQFEAPAYGIVFADADQVMVHMHDIADQTGQYL